jgi:hypothetical protein
MRSAPNYPAAYQDTGRSGQVTVQCNVLANRSVTDCQLLKVIGGDEFGDAVLAWLILPGARWQGRNVHPGVHVKTIFFKPPSKPRG